MRTAPLSQLILATALIACGGTTSEPPADVTPDGAVEVSGTDTAPSGDTARLSDASPRADTQTVETTSPDTGAETVPGTDTTDDAADASSKLEDITSEVSSEDTGPAPCVTDADCSDADPCTEDVCLANGACTFPLIAGCCIDADDCPDTGVACITKVCVANLCGVDDSACPVGEALVTTYAGKGVQGYLDGPVGEAYFANPYGVAVAPDGKVWVSDSYGETLRVISGGSVSTAAGGKNTPVGGPWPTPPTFGGWQDGAVTEALFRFPTGITFHPSSGAAYVGDAWNHTIRVIESGQVTTLAGSYIHTSGQYDVGLTQNYGCFADGPVAQAMFSWPIALTFGPDGALYVADAGNNRIRRIHEGQVETYAGASPTVSCTQQGPDGGFVDGPIEIAEFNEPTGLAFGAAGELFVADNLNNRVRMIKDGMVTTFAGTGDEATVDGPVASASFSRPIALTVVGTVIYVVEQTGHAIRRIANGEVTTLAGTGEADFVDGLGGVAAFAFPTSIAWDPANNTLLVADSQNQRIRVIVMKP